MTKVLPLCLLVALFAVPAAHAQNTYTTTGPFACNQEVCNGIPLDQGGSWQFILSNGTFSLSPTGGDGICGNPASTNCPGGISNVHDGIPFQTVVGAGPDGTLTFDFSAVDTDDGSTHSGSVVVMGFQTRKCYWRTCWDYLTIKSAALKVN